MKRNMIKLAAGAAAVLLLSTSAQAGYTMKKKVGDVDTKLTFFGFAQLEMVGGEGMQIKSGTTDAKADTNVAFRAQRIRLGWKYVAGKVRGKVFLDFNENAAYQAKTDGAAMTKLVKDAFISYVQDPAFVAKLGLIKMPNGMGFTMPGWNLDIAERGLDKSLVLERNMGLMISGRDMGLGNNGKVDGFEMGHERPWKGFGYDVMVANQASRSAAVSDTTKMGGLSYAVRGMFDYTEKLHLEASYALTENAGGLDQVVALNPANQYTNEDYSNINVGVDSNFGPLSLKAEYTTAQNIKGEKNYDETTVTATAGYFVLPQLELVGKYLRGDSERGVPGTNKLSTDITNAYLGFNYFISSPYQDFSRKAKRGRNQHKIVVNYILASGTGAMNNVNDINYDAKRWGGDAGGLGGYRADAFIVQYQFKF